MAQKNLHVAKQQKNDEFYTQLSDIANELRHYREQLRGKVILCNCDDPFESNFFKYFAANFNTLGLKKLITTGYTKSPITGSQLSLLDIEGLKPEGEEPYVAEINGVPDLNDDGAVSLDDVEYLLKHNRNVVKKLHGDGTYPAGDFRSAECIDLLKQVDIVVTNPPFSLFREFVAQLVEYEKQFLIIANKNSVTYKEIFRLIKNNKLWLGYRNINSDMWFQVPEGTKYEKVIDGKKMKHIMACWFTNLYVDKSKDPLTPYLTYEQGLARGLYPKYDNYDAIEVSKVTDIPSDYYGVMGVPITFLGRWVPDSGFDIVKFRKGDDDKDLQYTELASKQASKQARPLCRTSESSSSEFRIIGQTGVIEPDGICIEYKSGRPYINGARKYARVFVQRV